MYEVIYTGQFRRSFKLCARRGLNIQDFTTVLDILQEKGELPAQYRPHKLSGKYKGCWAVEIFFAFFFEVSIIFPIFANENLERKVYYVYSNIRI